MEELIEKISLMNGEELQKFCELDEEKEDPDALALEYHLLEMMGNSLGSETIGDEEQETPAEKLLRVCVEHMDSVATVDMILTLRDEFGE